MRNWLRLALVWIALLVAGFPSARPSCAYTSFYRDLEYLGQYSSNQHLVLGIIDAGRGGLVYHLPIASIPTPGLPLEAGLYVKGCDSSMGPLGQSTSTTYDYYIVYCLGKTTPTGGTNPNYYDLIAPGNEHHYFNNQVNSSTYTDTKDPSLLGATLTVTGSGFTLAYKNKTVYTFDASGGLIQIADSHNNTLVINRDSTTGFVTKVYNAANSGRYIAYTLGNDPNGQWQNQVVSITAQYQSGTTQTWSIGYDYYGKVQSVTLPNGGQYSYAWNQTYTYNYYPYAGFYVYLPTQITDPRGHAIQFSYDGYGKCLSYTNAVGAVYKFSYPSSVYETTSSITVTNPGGHSVTTNVGWRTNYFGYEVTSVVDNTLGETTSIAWNASYYLPSSVKDFRGRVTNFAWDSSKGNLLSRSWTTPAGATATESFTYDPATSALTSSADALGHTTTNTVNASGDVLTTTDPLGNQTALTWGSTGNLTAVTNALGKTSTMTYNSSGELLTATDLGPFQSQRSWDRTGGGRINDPCFLAP